MIIRNVKVYTPNKNFEEGEIRIRDGKMKGFNTDGEGFVRGLEQDQGVSVPDSTFVVVGAGGVSRAIMTVLASRKADAAAAGKRKSIWPTGPRKRQRLSAPASTSWWETAARRLPWTKG